MKYLFFVSVLFTILSGTSLSASAQHKTNSRGKTISDPGARPVKFIEGIEIKRNVEPVSETITPAIVTKTPVVETNSSDVAKCVHLQFKYAQLLNRNVEAVTNMPLFNFIESWWQTPYHFGGTDKSGVDCSGFSGLLFNNVYSTDIPRTAKEQYNACEKMNRDKLKEGDLVFFNTRGGVSHVGIYLGDGYFVHANISNGVTINNLDDDYYNVRFLGGGRILRNGDSVVKAGL